MKWHLYMHVITLVSGAVLGVTVYLFLNFENESTAMEGVLSAMLGIAIAFTIQILSKLLDRRISWREDTGLRLISGIVIYTLVALSITYIALIFIEVEDIAHISLKLAILIFCGALLFNVIYFIFYSYYYNTKEMVQAQAALRLQNELQLSALKSQLSPHFLFNSLNSLSALFYRRNSDAEIFIRSLAASFKYVLENYRNTLVPLAKELEFAGYYSEMMAIRFGSHLSIESNMNKELMDTKIPPLTMQILVENAIKHNLMDQDHPIEITIQHVDGYIEVSNVKNLRLQVGNSTRTGLVNISARYDLLQDKKVKIENSNIFKVCLPVIH